MNSQATIIDLQDINGICQVVANIGKKAIPKSGTTDAKPEDIKEEIGNEIILIDILAFIKIFLGNTEGQQCTAKDKHSIPSDIKTQDGKKDLVTRKEFDQLFFSPFFSTILS